MLGVIGVGAFLFFVKFESDGPELEVSGLSPVVGKRFSFVVKARDPKSGLKEVKVFVSQGKKRVLLKEESFPVTLLKGSEVKSLEWKVEVRPLELGLKEGEAKVEVFARDASWQHAFKGNLSKKFYSVRLDLTPPRVSLVTRSVYIVRGGSALVLYRLEEEPKTSGVWVNQNFFRGIHLKEGVYGVIVGVPVTDRSLKRLSVYVEDEAGNSLEIPLPHRFYNRKYPSYRMRISDAFLSRKMPEFISRYPEAQKEDLLKTFVWVNETLREKNNAEIKRLVSGYLSSEFFVSGAMKALPRSAKKSDFGEFREYYYRGRKVSEAWHLGLDLASVAGSPVPAAEKGRVIFADYLGIYGNTVIIDHGMGLFTLYAHLANFEVSVGELVERGRIIGYTDTTGLAGGDHLHFSVIVQGIFVNPIEWIDPRWVKSRIIAPLSLYR